MTNTITPGNLCLAALLIAIPVTGWAGDAGTLARPTPSAGSPTSPSQQSESIMVVDQAGFDEVRNSGKYDISSSLGDIAATVACEAGSVDDKCTEAMRQQLRQLASAKGANLVVIVNSSVLQSFPVRYSVNAQLYKATERR